MAALTAASWTLSVSERWRGDKKKWCRGTLAIPGTDTYPTGGIPLPAKEKFGFPNDINALMLFGVDATAGGTAEYHDRYDKANHKLLLYSEEVVAAGGPLLQALSTEVPGARTWNFVACGS